MGSIDLYTITMPFLPFMLSYIVMVRALGRNQKLGASELCEVSEDTKIGEGYNIASTETCNQFCDLTTGCEFWTWYNMVEEDDNVKDKVCFALRRCDLITQKCENCKSGKKREKSDG